MKIIFAAAIIIGIILATSIFVAFALTQQSKTYGNPDILEENHPPQDKP